MDQGAIRLDWPATSWRIPRGGGGGGGGGLGVWWILTAIGSYQLEEVLKHPKRLRHYDLPHSVVYMLEPGRFFAFPAMAKSWPMRRRPPSFSGSTPAPPCPAIFVTHTRPEPMAGTLQPLHTGYTSTRFLGFVNQGGTLDKDGMLFINRCTWAHVLAEVAQVLDRPLDDWLSQNELDALHGRDGRPQASLDLTRD